MYPKPYIPEVIIGANRSERFRKVSEAHISVRKDSKNLNRYRRILTGLDMSEVELEYILIHKFVFYANLLFREL